MSEYPEGFFDWPLEKRNVFFAEKARQYEARRDDPPERAPPIGEPRRDNGSGAKPLPVAPAFSDEALALRFAERHANDLRFVSAWGKWLSWTGTHWRFDDTLHAFDRARQIVREAAAACNKSKKIASAIASAKTVAAVERLSKSDRRLAATDGQWDDRPTIINTPRKGAAQ
jgi:hypothetical protein